MATPNAYDQIPYLSKPLPQTHPDRIASLATLLGLQPPAADRCRVLELGCASGGNLIPMALELPGATFIGIDLSAEQIAVGQQTIAALGLENISLKTLSILDVGLDLGTFDYILCHGVFSWVPPEVQERIFAIIAQQMAPDGIAYVSYNTLPGWYLRGALRDIMQYHSRNHEEPSEALRQARGVLGFLAASGGDDPEPYHAALRSEAAELIAAPDEYLFHEHLAPHNMPIYFHQFIYRAAAHGLRYVADTDFHAMILENFPPETQRVLRQIARSSIEVEQYMDFLRNRSFRQSLLCHSNRVPSGKIGPERLVTLKVASPLRPFVEAPDLASKAPVKFEEGTGLVVTLDEPFVKTALTILAEEWPIPIAFDQLRQRAREQLQPGVNDSAQAAADSRMLGELLFRMFSRSAHYLVEFSQAIPVYCRLAGEKPHGSPLARYQLMQGERVTTLRHLQVRLDALAQVVLSLLDGTRNRVQLLEILAELQREKRLPLPEKPEEITAGSWLIECLEGTLRELGRCALLMA